MFNRWPIHKPAVPGFQSWVSGSVWGGEEDVCGGQSTPGGYSKG